jgi:uncharacterized protein
VEVWDTPRILADMTPDALDEHAIDVADDPAQSRYVASVGGEVAGYSEYEIDEPRGRILIQHTEVDDAFEGHGVGGTLVSKTLDDARARGLEVLPFCRFVKSYIAKHPEYLDLVPEDQRGRFGL